MTVKPTEETKVSILVGDCEIAFEDGPEGKFSSTPIVHQNPKSEFLFEYNHASKLTDRLVHRQHEDHATGERITEILIVRKNATNIYGSESISIPLIKIKAK